MVRLFQNVGFENHWSTVVLEKNWMSIFLKLHIDIWSYYQESNGLLELKFNLWTKYEYFQVHRKQGFKMIGTRN